MLRGYACQFRKDEAGAGTIMGLLWFMLLVGITGMAVDTTNGFRNRTMLQATADASALAGVIDLPDEATAIISAADNSEGNMPTGDYGHVLQPGDVEIGSWDTATRIFTDGGVVENVLNPDGPLVPDAVRVTLHQTTANANAVPVNFLRIIGLQTWDVNVEAIAQRFIPTCLRDGLIARDMVYMSSNNGFVNRICIHGQQGVEIASNNYFETGVNVSMYDYDTMVLPDSGMVTNIGLYEALRESSRDPRMVNHVDEIMNSFLDPATSSWLPAYIDPALPVIEVARNGITSSTFVPGNVYHVTCESAGQEALIPANILIQGVVIVADCRVTFEAKVTLIDTVLASRNGGNGDITNSNITVNAQVQFGLPDNCAPGGGVQLFSNASMYFSAQTGIDGVQMVAAGNIGMNAREFGINGISAQAGGDIIMTSENAFGLCSGGTDGLFTVPYYRLVL